MATGSPARRGAVSHGTDRPVIRSVAAITSITLLPMPVPTLSAVECSAAGEVVERLDVGVGEIVDVDVVADARAVGRGVVVAEHLHRRALAERGLHHQRDEVERLRANPRRCRLSALAPAALK